MRIFVFTAMFLFAPEMTAQEVVRVTVTHPVSRVASGGKKEILLVLQAAIGTNQDKKFLFVVNNKNVVEYRPVSLGMADGPLQVIEPLKIVRSDQGIRLAAPNEAGENSLKAGDRVIIRGLQRVRPGTKVEAILVKDQAK